MKVFFSPNDYIEEFAWSELLRTFPEVERTTNASEAKLQWADYEDLDFQAALEDKFKWICAYSIRKALIRKHFLIDTIRHYIAKRDQSILKTAVPESWTLELDYVEFLDDALDESFELRGELELNEELDENDRKWFILKPSMAERGAGLRLFSTISELSEIFGEYEYAEEVTMEDLDDVVQEHTTMMTSDMRFFVIQQYMSDPLLLKSLQYRKFHIRAYVLCVGSLQVYLHRNLLVLCSARSYDKPCLDMQELDRHLTNTCYQSVLSGNSSGSLVKSFWSIEDPEMRHDQIWNELKHITHDLFDAASAQPINFQTIPNAFELFGLDFLVDAAGRAQLLEVNAFPDFAQTGSELKQLIHGVIRDTIKILLDNMQRQPGSGASIPYRGQMFGRFETCLASNKLG